MLSYKKEDEDRERIPMSHDIYLHSILRFVLCCESYRDHGLN